MAKEAIKYDRVGDLAIFLFGLIANYGMLGFFKVMKRYGL